MQRVNRLLILLLLLIPVKSICRQFSHSARLESIPASGFYSITITPELGAHLDATLKDLRIVDLKGAPVPYIINTTIPGLAKHSFQPLPIIENSIRDSGRSHLVLENILKQNIDGLALLIRNASVSRTAKISGSAPKNTTRLNMT